MSALTLRDCRLAKRGAELLLIYFLHSHSVFRVQSHSQGDYDALVELFQEDKLDFWTMPRIDGFTDIMVDPDQRDQLVDYLSARNMSYTLNIEDVER